MSGNPTNIIRRTRSITIFQGDDEEALRQLREEAERCKPDPKKRVARTLGDPDPDEQYAEAAKRHDDFKAEAETRGVEIVLQALRRKQWRELVAEHKPREDNGVDAHLGVNVVTFSEALIPASIIKPEFGSHADRDDFLDDLSDGQADSLFWAAWDLNRAGAPDPKDRLSNASQTSGETSS